MGDFVYRTITRHRVALLGLLVAAVAAAGAYAVGVTIDMSFRPTFSTEPELTSVTEEHKAEFGEVGFRDLVAIIEVGDLHDRDRMVAVAGLADDLASVDHVSEVRDPTSVPLFDRNGAFVPLALRDASGNVVDGAAFDERVDDLIASRPLRRLVVSDDQRHLALTATVDLPNEDFHGRRAVVDDITTTVERWSADTGMTASVTGYPQVEQVYAKEVARSVLIVIGVLYAVMIVVLFAYFRRWRDVFITLSGVTFAVPLVIGEMRLLDQPFSIVNSQVLTLVVIVGVAHALHHVEEYRRRREGGLRHDEANRTTFRTLAVPSLMTGLATAVGFLALRTADMPAVRSFGLCTAIGVATVYLMNWLVVPVLVGLAGRSSASTAATGTQTWVSRRISALMGSVANVVDRRPRRVVLLFVVSLAALAFVGIPRVSVNQLVNEELPKGHPALTAQSLYEEQFSGFLGPEVWLRAESGDVLSRPDELAAFVNEVCSLPDVRYVASPLDLVAQPPVDTVSGESCRRPSGDLLPLRGLVDAAPPNLRTFTTSLLGSSSGTDATVIVRLRDIGTANTLPFVDRVERIAEDTLGPGVTAVPAGQWWLAQNGIDRLSADIGFAAISALLVILPVILLAIRDWRLFLASILPTVMPVVAALAFMGFTGIPLRIGTAMILAISLGLAADDTIYLFLQVKRRVTLGSDHASALHATLRRTGRPAFYSSVVLICGFLSMTTSSLLALRDMGIVAAFTMAYALATDVLLGPALYRIMTQRPRWLTKGAPVWAPAT